MISTFCKYTINIYKHMYKNTFFSRFRKSRVNIMKNNNKISGFPTPIHPFLQVIFVHLYTLGSTSCVLSAGEISTLPRFYKKYGCVLNSTVSWLGQDSEHNKRIS